MNYQKDQKKKIKNHTSSVPHQLLTSLNFTDSARQLEELKSLIFNTPDLNEGKIELLKEEIASGRYEVQSKMIAKKLVEFQHLISQAEPA